jgi:hypothetical protein
MNVPIALKQALDVLLRDRSLLAPIAAHWEGEAAAGRASVDYGRPTIAMETYVRLMVIKHRTGWGTRRWCGRSRTRCICGASV